jgi:hypothetical protein
VPHWQVVNTNGKTSLLNRLAIKDDTQNRMIALPAYINDVAKGRFGVHVPKCCWARHRSRSPSWRHPERAHIPTADS